MEKTNATSLLVKTILTLFFLSSITLAATTLAPCPANQICMYYGATLDKIPSGSNGAAFSTSSFACPVNAPITGAFGVAYGSGQDRRMRFGIEMNLAEGTAVRAPAAGTVLETGYDLSGVGHYIIIRHSKNPVVDTKIGYLQGPATALGSQAVSSGQEIGKSGKSGAAKWPSVYFELDRGGIPQREVEDICKSAIVATSAPAALAGKADCTQFTNNPVPDSWSVVAGGRFGAGRNGANYKEHDGFDYGGFDCGQPVKAVWSGQVRYYRNTGAGYGNEVSIKTACSDGSEKIVTYDHLQGFNPAALDKGTVQAGDLIAYLGNTGGSYPCHLHVNVFGPPFRIQNGLDAGNVLNPETYVKGGLQGHLA